MRISSRIETGIKVRILEKLARKKCWGGKHMSGDFLIKMLHKYHLEGEYRKALRDLVKEGLIIDHAKSYGAYSLNPRMKGGIEHCIRKYEEENQSKNLDD